MKLITRLLLRIPRIVIFVAVLLAVLSVVVTVKEMEFHTSRLDLLNPNSGYNKLWIDYLDEFGAEDDAVVVIEGPNRQQVLSALEDLSKELAHEERLFHSVLHEIDLSKIRSKGLHYLSLAELAQIQQLLQKVAPVLDGDWSQLDLGKIIAGINYQLGSPQNNSLSSAQRAATQSELTNLSQSLLKSLQQPGRFQSPWPQISDDLDRLSQFDSEYRLANEGKFGFLLLRLGEGKVEFAQSSEAIDRLREIIGETQSRHPGIEIGITGLPVMENDEMRASQQDMVKASLLSLFGVAVLFIAGFGGLRHPLLTVAALLLAMAWAFGYVTLGLGHLNILSVSFGVILIGLGIDFGIHYVARYLHLRRSEPRSDLALIETSGSIGPGIITGGVTTALAFFTAAWTELTGIAELGIIAGGGILLCVFAMLLVLPAMIHLADRQHTIRTMPKPLKIDTWVAPLLQFPKTTFLSALLLSAILAIGNFHLRYDHNLLNLQPLGLESVRLERKLLEETDQSVWFALSIAESREELLARKAQFLQLDSVDKTEEIVSWLPTNQEEKQPIVAEVSSRIRRLSERPPLIPVSPPEQIGRQLAIAQASIVGTDSAARLTRRQLQQTRDLLRQMTPQECYSRLSDYQQRMAGDLLNQLHSLRSMANPEPPQLADLPKSLVTRFVGKSNRHLLKIYSQGDIWDMDALEKFVLDVKQIDPLATGQPLQTFYASRQMQRSYIHAAIYALLAVMIVLLLDFRSIRYTLLTMLPVALGTIQLFGLLGLLDIPLNPANMIVLPLILGIGIDDGVHVVHDFRLQKGRYRLSSSTAMAVLLTSLTTMVGFGSLMLAGHQGLQSLGRVLTIGVTCCLFSSIVILPALLCWLTSGRSAEEEEPQKNRRIPRRSYDSSEHRPDPTAKNQDSWPEKKDPMNSPSHGQFDR